MASSISSPAASSVVDLMSAGQNMSSTPEIFAAIELLKAVQPSTSAQAAVTACSSGSAATTASSVVSSCSGSSVDLHYNTVHLLSSGVGFRT